MDSTPDPLPPYRGEALRATVLLTDLDAMASSRSDEMDWERVAKHIAHLSRSPRVWIFTLTPVDKMPQTLAESNDGSENPEAQPLLKQAVDLLGSVGPTGHAFGPTSVPNSKLAEPALLCVELGSYGAHGPIAVAALTDHLPVERFQESVVRLQLYRRWLQAVAAGHGSDEATVLDFLTIFHRLFDERRFVLAAMKLVNEMAALLGCQRVSLGWRRGDYIEPVAISRLEKFDSNSAMVRDLRDLFEESVDLDESTNLSGDPETEWPGRRDHLRIARVRQLSQLVSLPLRVSGEPKGSVVLEMERGHLSEGTIRRWDIVLQHLAPWLALLEERDGHLPARSWRALRRHGRWWLGPRHTLAKMIAIVVAVTLLASCIIRVDHHVEAPCSLVTDEVAFLSAPFNGFVEEVLFHTGDRVEKDEVVVRMDREELLFRQLEEKAKVVRFRSESEKARSQRDLVDMKVALARMEQSAAELERIEYYLEHAQIRTPLPGIVVEGDRDELLGAPVDKGQTLVKVARAAHLYIEMKVEERDIDEVREGEAGEVVLLSQPDRKHPVRVNRIVPMARVEGDGGNVVTVKANLLNPPEPWWRPGMSGLVRIHVGRRPLIWMALHRTVETLRYYLWI